MADHLEADESGRVEALPQHPVGDDVLDVVRPSSRASPPRGKSGSPCDGARRIGRREREPSPRPETENVRRDSTLETHRSCSRVGGASARQDIDGDCGASKVSRAALVSRERRPHRSNSRWSRSSSSRGGVDLLMRPHISPRTDSSTPKTARCPFRSRRRVTGGRLYGGAALLPFSPSEEVAAKRSSGRRGRAR